VTGEEPHRRPSKIKEGCWCRRRGPQALLRHMPSRMVSAETQKGGPLIAVKPALYNECFCKQALGSQLPVVRPPLQSVI
jgi:hypothetical protein